MKKGLIDGKFILNKVTGGLLFVFPLTLTFIDLRYSAAVVCVVATAAAIQEGYLIKKKIVGIDRRCMYNRRKSHA